jgi:hypothetical protein
LRGDRDSGDLRSDPDAAQSCALLRRQVDASARPGDLVFGKPVEPRVLHSIPTLSIAGH